MIDYILNDIKYFFDGLRRKLERAQNANTAEDTQINITAQELDEFVKQNTALIKANAALRKRCEELQRRQAQT